MKKKILAGSIICLCLLAGCTGAQSSTDTSLSPLPTLSSSISFASKEIRTDVFAETTTYPGIVIIVSKTELDNYIELVKGANNLDINEAFASAVTEYDDTFFEDYMLVLVLLNEPSSSIRHTVSSITPGTDGVKIHIESEIPDVRTDEQAEWHIIVEIDRQYKGSEFQAICMN